MDLAWIAPPLVLLAGAAGIAVALRRVARATTELAASHRRSRRIEDALIPIRVETRRARSSVDHLRHR